jgi:mannose-6-phosphate isomerase-like protein (cupin superfamily)
MSPTEALTRLALVPDRTFVELFRHGSLVVEIYRPRGTDRQQLHTRDEVYVVISGHGDFVCAGERRRFGPGDFLFAAAAVEHRFEHFSPDFATWVIFYGPEGGETP